MMEEISSVRGSCEAPRSFLLALAHALATGNHWWLWSPADRSQTAWVFPTPARLEEAANQPAADPQFAPYIKLRGTRFEWVPISNGDMEDPDSRRITIILEDGAEAGTIEWYAGLETEKKEFPCSSFLASILVILPGAVDDGTVGRYMAAGDEQEARRVAACRAAQAAGGGDICHATGSEGSIAFSSEVSKGGDFHLGYSPRRSWTADGQERRFARWPTPAEREAMVAAALPLPWRFCKDAPQ